MFDRILTFKGLCKIKALLCLIQTHNLLWSQDLVCVDFVQGRKHLLSTCCMKQTVQKRKRIMKEKNGVVSIL